MGIFKSIYYSPDGLEKPSQVKTECRLEVKTYPTQSNLVTVDAFISNINYNKSKKGSYMNGRVIFTKDFLNKTQKPITHKELGELRVQKIIEAQNDGRLTKARNRLDVGELVGISRDRVAVANSWVYRQISLGYLTETLLQFDKNHLPEYEYHYYENKLAKSKSKSKSKKPVNHGIKTPVVKPTPVVQPTPPTVTPEPVASQPVTSQPAELSIPLNQDMLEKGLSLTLNINFIFNK